MPGVHTTLMMVRSRSWWRGVSLASRGVPSAASTSAGFAMARSRISLIASSGAVWVSAARQSATKWSRFSMVALLSSSTIGMAPACCPMHSRATDLCLSGLGEMDLRHLRYFVTVAETGAFSRAATRLRITQPALWRQVRDLERELGVRLFERVGRRVRVTGAGEGLLLRSRELLAGVDRLAEQAQAVRGGEVGSLSIGASPQMIQNVLAPFLSRYLRSRPGVDIQLIEEGAVRAAELVERGDVQLGMAIRSGHDRLEGRLLFPLRVLAAVAPRHRLAHRATIDLTDLEGERVLVLRRGFGTRELFDGACRVAHVHAHIVLEA